MNPSIFKASPLLLLIAFSTIIFSCHHDSATGNGAVIKETNKDDYEQMRGKGDDVKDNTRVNKVGEKDDSMHIDSVSNQGHAPHH